MWLALKEMIKMNIPIIHNGDYEKAIPWKNINCIIDSIKKNEPKILIIFEGFIEPIKLFLSIATIIDIIGFILILKLLYVHLDYSLLVKNHYIH